jgi:hypothetical protein
MRALGNDHLVLRDTCRGWNNFFARAFETPLLAGSLFGELCAMFVPGARPVERKIEQDGVIRRVTRAGVWEEQLPVGTFERCFAVRLTNMSTGGEFEAVVTLPEPIETLVVGHKDRTTPRAERMAKRAARVVEEHVRATLEDPLRDPGLHATLRAHDVGEVAIFGEALSGASAPPSVQMRSRRSQTSVEAMLKASGKSAWCYAALRLGRSYRVDPHGRRLLAAVKGCATPYEADQAPATLVDTLEFDPPVGRVGVWRRPWAEVQAALVGVPPRFAAPPSPSSPKARFQVPGRAGTTLHRRGCRPRGGPATLPLPHVVPPAGGVPGGCSWTRSRRDRRCTEPVRRHHPCRGPGVEGTAHRRVRRLRRPALSDGTVRRARASASPSHAHPKALRRHRLRDRRPLA